MADDNKTQYQDQTEDFNLEDQGMPSEGDKQKGGTQEYSQDQVGQDTPSDGTSLTEDTNL